MTYKETIDYLYRLLPVYQNKGVSAIKKDLSNITELCSILENPQYNYKTIHVGGTNGKGTVSHMISSILQESGYKVGLYTSPHYLDFRERIKVNGHYVPEDYVINFVAEIKDAIAEIRPSFFELTVAMAFQYFKESKVDYAVIEVGLGGRLDSTNIISPILSVITNIGLDHQNMLGNSISEIAMEKAGIIKNRVPVVIGEFDDESAYVFIKKASEKDATISFASQNWNKEFLGVNKFRISDNNGNGVIHDIEMQISDPFLVSNTMTTLEAISSSKLTPEVTAIYKGIENFKRNTSYIGRWQMISVAPDIIADSGHNAHAISQSMDYLKSLHYINNLYVMGFVSDKNISEILKLLPKEGRYYFAKPNLSRGAQVSSYSSEATKCGLNFQSCSSVSDALQSAKRSSKEGDLIFVGGSSFVVAEVLAEQKDY